MKRLFQFIYYYRAFFTFLFFEIICALIIAGSGKYQSSSFFNTTNFISSTVFTIKNDIGSYFSLKKHNLDLARENAFLRQIISESEGSRKLKLPEYSNTDTALTRQYEYITAKVINNSVRRINNYLTINKGKSDGIAPGMGVISSWGIVGKIRACSQDFSTVFSLLHSDMLVSSEIRRNNVICTTTWTGDDPDHADLMYVPRHIQIFKGDTVVTSGYNAVFPENIPIGVIDNFWINENETFYHIKVKLATDFRTLSYVYVIKNNFRAEKDSLEQATYNR